ncbi:C39 family peptidase [Propionibacteriaceae bacterium Y2011]
MTLARRRFLGAAATAAVATAAATVVPRDAEAASWRPIRAFVVDNAARWNTGTFTALGVDARGGLVQRSGLRRTVFRDPHTGIARPYDYGWWTSSTYELDFGATQVIASWDATTPRGAYVDVAVQARTASGAWTRWYVVARWGQGDTSADLTRASVAGQQDAYGTVQTDTLVARGSHAFTAVRFRFMLLKAPGGAAPRVGLGAIMASRVPNTPEVTNRVWTHPLNLPVPTYSQERHKGHYPQWDGGGEAWCSATSTAMVLDYWGRGPSRTETAWVTQPGESRPQVDHAARYCYDHQYRGTGNWPFNTAHASTRGLRCYVTRLRNLREAEMFVNAGVPLIVSVSFSSGELDGAGYSTAGHLLVIVGFTPAGHVICNDPASHLRPDDGQVRFTYNRRQFEKVWLPSGRSGGLTYVIAPWGHRLPTALSYEPNWL